MEDNFTVIAITPVEPFAGEEVWIRKLLDSGRANRVHVRHPGMSADDMRRLIDAIGDDYIDRISLHDHPELVHGEIGFHFNSRNPYTILEGTGKRSMSLHGPSDNLPRLDYIILSPVFDSISKADCKRNPDLDPSMFDVPVIALGGVTPERFSELIERGYAGAAMLGYFQYK